MVNKSKTLEIHLKRFQPQKMQTNRVCLMVGKKGTGKSTLVKDIMWFQQHIPVGAIMSGTEETNEAYGEMAPPLFIYKNFDADALQRLINRQKKMKSLYKQNHDSLPFDHRAFVIIDDCMYDKKAFSNPLIRELFMNGRHWDLFVLITMQYVMDIPPAMRTNTDYIFALKENVIKNRERLYKEFFGVFQSFPVFDALMLEVTQDHRCLVLDTTVNSTNVEDCVFWYKAQPRDECRLGSDWFWEYGQKNSLRPYESNAEKNALKQLEEMNQKAVKVVFEGQRRQQNQQMQQMRPQQSRVQFERQGRRPPHSSEPQSRVNFRGGGGGPPPSAPHYQQQERRNYPSQDSYHPMYDYEENREYRDYGRPDYQREYQAPPQVYERYERPYRVYNRGLEMSRESAHFYSSSAESSQSVQSNQVDPNMIPQRAVYSSETTSKNPFMQTYSAPSYSSAIGSYFQGDVPYHSRSQREFGGFI